MDVSFLFVNYRILRGRERERVVFIMFLFIVCFFSEFVCNDIGICILGYFIRDGFVDCDDLLDERE